MIKNLTLSSTPIIKSLPVLPTSENALYDYATVRGIRIENADIKELGRYYHQYRLIVLNKALTSFQIPPVLMHELCHAHRQDIGHQSKEIELAIEKHIARLLVNPQEYARAEAETQGNIYGMAFYLNLPIRVVANYRNFLSVNPPVDMVVDRKAIRDI